MELQESPRHLGIYNETSRQVMTLLTHMIRKPWDGQHSCDSDTKRVNCMFCQNIALWHQMASQLMELVCPRDPLKLPPKDLPRADEIQRQTISESPLPSQCRLGFVLIASVAVSSSSRVATLFLCFARSFGLV
jgi:hypothetical protein